MSTETDRKVAAVLAALLVLFLIGQFSITLAQDVTVTSQIASIPRTSSAEVMRRPVALTDGAGRMHQKVSTDSAEAQAYYDLGIAYLHSYVWVEGTVQDPPGTHFGTAGISHYFNLRCHIGTPGHIVEISQSLPYLIYWGIDSHRIIAAHISLLPLIHVNSHQLQTTIIHNLDRLQWKMRYPTRDRSKIHSKIPTWRPK